MEFNFSKVISCKNVDKAEIGKEYYLIGEIDDELVFGDFNDISKGKLEGVDKSGVMCPFKCCDLVYPFLYPVEHTDRPLTYKEMKERWLKNPTELYKHGNVVGMITSFNDNNEQFCINDCYYSEEPISNSDQWLIKNLTDINGNPLTVKEDLS